MKGPEKDVLADVLGVVGANDARRDAEHDAAMAFHELLEGAQIALQRALGEALVRFHRRGFAAASPLWDPRAGRLVTS